MDEGDWKEKTRQRREEQMRRGLKIRREENRREQDVKVKEKERELVDIEEVIANPNH